MSTPSPDFLKFIGYLGLPLTATNLAFFTDLFVNFTQFYSEPNDSLEIKFIKWKRFYDASSFPLQISPTQNLLQTTEFNYIDAINTDTEHISQPYWTVDVLPQASPPTPTSPQAEQQPCDHQINAPPPPTPTSPPQLVENNIQLPHKLISIQNSENCYQNFILKNEDEAAANMTEHIEIMATSLDQQPPPISSKGKNITQMKEIYKENKSKQIPKPRPRKRKRVSPNVYDDTELIPPTETRNRNQNRNTSRWTNNARNRIRTRKTH